MTGPEFLLKSTQAPCRAFDVALFDLDGVVYIGDSAVPGAVECIAQVREEGMRCAFVTNNAGRTPEMVAQHLCELGVSAEPHEVVTSAQAGARLLAERLPSGSFVLAVGGEGVARALIGVGLVPVSRHEDHPVAVLQGFGRNVGWSDLASASLAVRSGAYWVATNPDRTFPIPGGRAPGNGMMVAAVAEAAGRVPDAVAGKPFPPLMIESIERTRARHPVVVGDRLDTDIEGARAVKVSSLLVMTGVTDVEHLLRAAPELRPDFLSADLRGLLRPHESPARDDGSWSLGASRARVDRGILSVDGAAEDWENALRCACQAAWSIGTADVADAARALESHRPPVHP